MRQFIVVAVTLIMFFAAGIHLDFGDEVELPEWVEELISEDKGSIVDMTHSPIFRIARTRMTPIDEELAPPSAR